MDADRGSNGSNGSSTGCSSRRSSHSSGRATQPDCRLLEHLDGLLLQPPDVEIFLKGEQDHQNTEGNALAEASHTSNITEHERHLLYVEVLYTIKHKVGSTCGSYSSAQSDLFEYARRAFRMSDAEHGQMLTQASEEKAPIVILHVTVVEARNLEAKDANGFSDPYCMLGIIPGSRLAETDGGGGGGGGGVNYDPDEESDQARRGRKKGAFTKFSASVRASFRRKEKKKAIPAKYIQTTTVRQKTLNPEWNEKFRFDLESAATDTLHLDVWDHDDEASVFELAKRLNEVQNLRGLGRMFKDIAQSARQKNASADDFLGCVDIPTKDVPSTGADAWYVLRRRSSRSSVSGELRLRLRLATREDRGGASEDGGDWNEVRQHRGLAETFLAHELSSRRVASTGNGGFVLDDSWDGSLPIEAHTILHQHAIQGDLTECQSAACRWLAYSDAFPAFYAKCLPSLLQRLDELWSPGELPRNEEERLGDSFITFLSKVFEFIESTQRLLSRHNKETAESTRLCLRCVQQLQKMKLYRHCCPFSKDAVCEVMLAVKAGCQAWFEALKNQLRKGCDDDAQFYAKLCAVAFASCQAAHDHCESIFKESIDADYTSVLYKVIDASLAEEVRCYVSNLAVSNQECGSPPPYAPDTPRRISESELRISAAREKLLTAAFGLYFPLQRLANAAVKFAGSNERVLLQTYQNWFSPFVQEWAAQMRTTTSTRVVDSAKDDKLYTTNRNFGSSSSAATVSNCYALVIRFWLSLEWVDADETFAFVLKLLDIICNMISKYCEALQSRLKKEAYCDSEGQFNVHPKLCVALNNLNVVRNLLYTLPTDLKLSAATRGLCSSQSGAYAHDEQHVGLVVCSSLVESCDAYIAGTVEAIASKVADRIKADIRRNFQLLLLSADSVAVQQAIHPLLDYLESNLCIMRKHLLSPAAIKMLTLRVWMEVLREAETCYKSEQVQSSNDFYPRLHDAILVLLDFFQAGNNHVGLKDLKTDHFQKLQHSLWLERRPTEDLIAMFYKSQCDLQKNQEPTKSQLGSIAVRALYQSSEGVLAIEVVNCKNLAPLDTNGFSDPYVVVELVPKHIFSNQPTKETSVKKKTLNPTFENTFEFVISQDSCRENGAAVRFTVMDYDFLMDNDFGGEAFLALADIPGVNSCTNPRGLQHAKAIHLAVLKPQNPEGTDVMQVLAKRPNEKLALEFFKQRKQIATMAAQSLPNI